MVRNTVFYRYLLVSLRDLFDVEEKDLYYCDDWRRASQRIRGVQPRAQRPGGAELAARMGTTATVLDAKAGLAILPNTEPSDHIPDQRHSSRWIHPRRSPARQIPGGLPRKEFRAVGGALRGDVRAQPEERGGRVQCGLAYNRRLDFDNPPQQEAARIFDRGVLEASPQEKKVFQDYMMNRLAELCVEADVPLQIHTGMTSHVGDSSPVHLTGVLLQPSRPARRPVPRRLSLEHPGPA